MPLKQTDLETIARQLRAALKLIEAELAPPPIPPEIEAEMLRKMENRICLAWDHPITEGDDVRRGLCETCYSTLTARIRRGQESEIDLMVQGKLGPKAQRGRKAALDIAASHKAAEAEMERQRKATKTSKAADPKATYKKKTDE